MTAAELNAPVCRHCGADAENLHSIERATSWRYVDWQYSPAVPERIIEPTATSPGGVIPAVPAGWHTGDEWGDDVGDSDAHTVGIACGSCYVEVHFDAHDNEDGKEHDAGELITTAAAFARSHPLRRWSVAVERVKVRGDRGEEPVRLADDSIEWRKVREPVAEVREHRRQTVTARTEREAIASAGQNGMQPDGSYPWRPASPYGPNAPDRVRLIA